ncbi:MAG: tetratricopeptide repeat protein [Owenweeksia sp.]|nr:tetratricopeptide repeat protein [Owenweeksia sp.]
MNKPFLSLIGSLFLLNSAYSQDPGLNINAADTIRKGIEYNDEGDYEQAITMFNKVHPGDTNYTWALYEKSLSLTEAEMYPEAISTARQGIRLTDSASSLYFNIIGTALDHSDQQQEALAVYEAGIQRFPVDHKLFYNRSVVYDNLEEHAKTLADLKKLLSTIPFTPPPTWASPKWLCKKSNLPRPCYHWATT